MCDHCHLTGKNRGPAHSKINFKVTQDKCNINPFRFHNFSYNDCHLFFEKLVDKKHDKVKFDNLPKSNEEYVSVSYGCIKFIGSFRFLSNSLGSLVKTLIDNSHETLKNLEEENVDKDDKLNVVNGKKFLFKDDRYNIDSIKNLKKDYPDKIKNLEEALLEYMGEIDLKILKTEFPVNKRKFLTEKLADLYEYFKSLDDYQTPVDNLKI